MRSQLQEENTNYTAIESLVPEWIKNWIGPVTYTEIFPSQPAQVFFAEVTRAFERSFSRNHRAIRILKLTYSSAADELADLDGTQRQRQSQTPLPAIETATAITVEEEPALPPSMLISHLLDWLQITYDELAEITGVSRSALFYWRKTGATPRASNVRQVMRLYSLAALLVRRFGKEGARRWLHSDGLIAWESLRQGEIEQAEDVVRSKLFGQKEHPSRGGRALSEEADFSKGIGGNAPVKRAARRPKRGRPGSS